MRAFGRAGRPRVGRPAALSSSRARDSQVPTRGRPARGVLTRSRLTRHSVLEELRNYMRRVGSHRNVLGSPARYRRTSGASTSPDVCDPYTPTTPNGGARRFPQDEERVRRPDRSDNAQTGEVRARDARQSSRAYSTAASGCFWAVAIVEPGGLLRLLLSCLKRRSGPAPAGCLSRVLRGRRGHEGGRCAFSPDQLVAQREAAAVMQPVD